MPLPDLTERLIRLRMVPVFAALPSSELALIASTLRARTFEKGEVLLREDEPPRSFWLLQSGTVTMRRRGNRIGTVRAPGAVGFLSLVARSAGSTAAVAESFVEALEVRGDVLEDVFEDHFNVILATMRFVADRMFAELIKRAPPPFSPPDYPVEQLVGDAPLGVVERIFLLRRTPAFGRANVNSLAAMAKRMTEVRGSPGQVLWRPGERASHTYFFVTGMGRLVWEGGEKQQRVGAGYVVGGVEAITRRPRWNELVVDEPSVLLEAPREVMLDLFEDDRELATQFLSTIASIVMNMWDRNAEAGVSSVGGGPPSERSLAAAEPKAGDARQERAKETAAGP